MEWEQLVEDYEDYCKLKSLGIELLVEVSKVRIVLHNIMVHFAGPLEKAEQMAQALLSGGKSPCRLGLLHVDKMSR